MHLLGIYLCDNIFCETCFPYHQKVRLEGSQPYPPWTFWRLKSPVKNHPRGSHEPLVSGSFTSPLLSFMSHPFSGRFSASGDKGQHTSHTTPANGQVSILTKSYQARVTYLNWSQTPDNQAWFPCPGKRHACMHTCTHIHTYTQAVNMTVQTELVLAEKSLGSEVWSPSHSASHVTQGSFNYAVAV